MDFSKFPGASRFATLKRVLADEGFYGVFSLLRERLSRRVERHAEYRYRQPQRPASLADLDRIDFSIFLEGGQEPSERFLESLNAQWHSAFELLQRGQPIKTDYVVYFRSCDVLAEDALYEIALLVRSQDCDFVYADDDEIEGAGFAKPRFKPDWSPELLMSSPYCGPLLALRKSLWNEISGAESMDPWELALRAGEMGGKGAHIPKVLCHRGQEAASANEGTQRRALARRSLKGRLEPVVEVPGAYRVAYEVKDTPLVSIVIPTRDGLKLETCVGSILDRTRYANFEIVLVDNGSQTKDTLKFLAELKVRPNVSVVPHDAPFNFSEINNVAVGVAKGTYLLFLNDDTEVFQEEWLERMLGFAQLPHIGAVGAKLLYPNRESVQHNGILALEMGPSHAFQFKPRNEPGYMGRNVLESNWLAVTGACLMVSRAKFLEIGGFDESFAVAYNDVDLCMRLVEAGYFNTVCCGAELVHHESMSRGKDRRDPEKVARLNAERKLLFEKHPEFKDRDPFHSPNLDRSSTQFELPQ